MNWLVRLYPRAWSARYGDELDDLVRLRPLGIAGSMDLVRGALDAHRHPELVDPWASEVASGSPGVTSQRLADLRVARRLGRGAMLGSVLWIAGWVIASNGPLVVDGYGSYRDGSAGMPFVLLAMVLLSAGLLGQLVRMPRSSRVARTGAIAAACTLPFFGMAPWVLPLGAVALAGLLTVALGAAYAGQWSWGAAGALVVPGLVGAAIMAWALIGFGGDRVDVYGPIFFAVLAFMPLWLVVGATLQSLPPVNHLDGDEQIAPRGPVRA